MTEIFWFELENETIGYIKYLQRQDHVFIELIVIYKAKRGHGYSKMMFDQFVDLFPASKIELVAREDTDRYDKLFGLYRSWGFREVGKTSYHSDNDSSYRECLFRRLPV